MTKPGQAPEAKALFDPVCGCFLSAAYVRSHLCLPFCKSEMSRKHLHFDQTFTLSLRLCGKIEKTKTAFQLNRTF